MNHIRIRKIIHNSHCEYIGEFECPDIIFFFKLYTGIWMRENTDNEGMITNETISNLIESSDEFNILEEDYFIIGYPVTHMYEGMYVGSDSIFISKPDKYGFETIKNIKGTELQYQNAINTF